MQRIAAVIAGVGLACVTTGATAVASTGEPPPGAALVSETIECAAGSTEVTRTPVAGFVPPYWTDSGRMLLLRAVHVDFWVYDQEGGTLQRSGSRDVSFGNKSGMNTTITCTSSGSGIGPDGTYFERTRTLRFAVVPRT